MLKRRVIAELTQAQVAGKLGVNEHTYSLWEQDNAVPLVRYCPAIFVFLGYDPFPPPSTLAEQIASKRRTLGLAQEEAARLLGVNEGTFARWENGSGEPVISWDRVMTFLDAEARDDLLTKGLAKRGRRVKESDRGL